MNNIIGDIRIIVDRYSNAGKVSSHEFKFIIDQLKDILAKKHVIENGLNMQASNASSPFPSPIRIEDKELSTSQTRKFETDFNRM